MTNNGNFNSNQFSKVGRSVDHKNEIFSDTSGLRIGKSMIVWRRTLFLLSLSLSLYRGSSFFFSFFFSCLLEVHSSHGIRYTYPLLNLSKGIQQLFQKESWNSIKMDHWSWVHPWTFSDYGYKNETCWLVQAIQGYSCTEDSEMSDGLSQNKIWLLFEREKEGTEF